MCSIAVVVGNCFSTST